MRIALSQAHTPVPRRDIARETYRVAPPVSRQMTPEERAWLDGLKPQKPETADTYRRGRG